MDTLTKEQRSWTMSRVRDRDTKPEWIVRRMVYGMGFRYRVHRRDLPGRPDLAFISRKKAIFVHGCFWHSHADGTCSAAKMPATNRDYWQAKLKRNTERDAEAISALHHRGWQTLTVWECWLKDKERTSKILKRFLAGHGETEG
ncbi:DNA mismatch endonuclease Vsr [Mesorhizobium sp. B3-1-3]|uniref:very short patch repair endonuclease n=1 Tax=unclassified Mesorhizobium TaxID=325217 RepID=UPI00112BAFA4|nr:MULTISPECIES: very short patch repair endonuclease [unclassified Mesorhizobium]TPI67574.1 DNA mismatch endonuclease Vsr [Mesorhizobium sp. B3-1-8]TPI75620.1 DNA mismatch endonuclease Vsr [Mesorhizobium sp. B3-1-3]